MPFLLDEVCFLGLSLSLSLPVFLLPTLSTMFECFSQERVSRGSSHSTESFLSTHIFVDGGLLNYKLSYNSWFPFCKNFFLHQQKLLSPTRASDLFLVFRVSDF